MRKIHFSEEEIWKYKIGKHFIEIKDPDNKKYVSTIVNLLEAVTGEDVYRKYASFYCGYDRFNEEDRPEVRPAHIKKYIEEEIKNK